ncbi:hypothetical protein DL89DRAFT_268484 [Linderina pennispora]|uniref:Uncharacterized protein n=1 Tax=Linderina pennispora TaxID=61395 RepID=A0A1Y1W651_9FUNG|nr:uncharacterized protein DL89DRAFT_268484 [Linderina pennispora]ORX68716.1 hypothetical protein DL89DRAFT_268484 [Linderina pennispora]
MAEFGFSPNNLLISNVVGGVLGFVLLVLVYVVLMGKWTAAQCSTEEIPRLLNQAPFD